MGEFEQSRSEEILTQTLRKLNGEAVSELAPPQSRMETLLQQLLDKIGSGSGGGGSGGGALIVTISYAIDYYSRHTMDKTAGEIKAAFEAGKPIVCIEPGDGNYFSTLYSTAAVFRTDLDRSAHQPNGYAILVFDQYGYAQSYFADTLDDYPYFIPE